MRYRVAFTLALTSLAATAALGAACSNDVVYVQAPDTTDGATPDAGAPDVAINKPDTSTPVCTAGVSAWGACDLVSQNCAGGQECVFALAADGGDDTVCQPPGKGAIVKGDTCTPGPDNPCVPGLTCVSGRCAAYCCHSQPGGTGDSTPCGSSPEGYPGVCDIVISDGKGNVPYWVCQYNPPCQLFGVMPCQPGSECSIKDPAGTATCQTISPLPGKGEGAACVYANECKDGMFCLQGACAWECFKPKGGPPPFDAGALDLTMPGRGGCPPTESCAGGVSGLPTWLGFCQ